MNEKVIPEMALMPKDVKGKYTVQLFDAKTNELVQEVENHNMVNPFLATLIFKGLYASPVISGTWGWSMLDNISSVSNSGGLTDVLTLFKSSVEPKDSLTMYPDDIVSSGWCDLRSSGNSDMTLRGNVNLNETYCKLAISEDGTPVVKKHIVVDFLTNQGNGTFNSIGIGGNRVNTFIQEKAPSINGEYSNYDFEKFPKLFIDGTTWAPEGAVPKGYSSYGPMSIESDHVFWICGCYNYNSESDVCFYKFDISEGFINCTQVVKLSGAPSEIISDGMYGVRCQGKFFVFCSSDARKDYMYKFSETGSYESRISISKSVKQSKLYYGSLVALPNCIIECRSSDSDNWASLRITDVDGNVLFVKDYEELSKWFAKLANFKSIDIKGIKIVPHVLSNNKIVAILHGNRRSDYGCVLYDPIADKFEKSPYDIYWQKYSSFYNSNIGQSGAVFKNQFIQVTEYGIKTSVAVPWWSWSKLATEVTKTSSTTMKIQYDVEIPMILPGSMQLFNKK